MSAKNSQSVKSKGKKAVAPKVVKSSEPTEEKKERKRREVSKETVDADFDTIQQRINDEVERLRANTDKKVRGIKFLRSINKAIKILHSDTKRVMKLKKKNNRKKTVVSGFLKPINISPELAKFTGWDVNGAYSRVTVTKFICEYIKKNLLFDQTDKRKILVDAKLQALLNYDPKNPPKNENGEPEVLNYFRLQKHLKSHFRPLVVPVGSEEEKVEDAPKKKASAKAPKAAAKKAAKAKEVEEDVEEEQLE